MVAALMFGMIALIFYVIYESVIAEDRQEKKKFSESMKKKD